MVQVRVLAEVAESPEASAPTSGCRGKPPARGTREPVATITGERARLLDDLPGTYSRCEVTCP